jgi:hypothetical protein
MGVGDAHKHSTQTAAPLIVYGTPTDSVFCNRVATIRTTSFKIQNHYILPSHFNYEFPKTLRKGAVTGSCLSRSRGVFTAGEEPKFVNLGLISVNHASQCTAVMSVWYCINCYTV